MDHTASIFLHAPHSLASLPLFDYVEYPLGIPSAPQSRIPAKSVTLYEKANSCKINLLENPTELHVSPFAYFSRLMAKAQVS
jgi:hypothetical protein